MAGSTRSYEMARRLVAHGHEVHMITSWREPGKRRGWFTTEEAGIRVHWLPVPYSNMMNFPRRMLSFIDFAVTSARKAASLTADVVFATSTPLTIVLPGIYASKRNRIPLVFEVRDMWPDVPIALGILRNSLLIILARALEKAAYRLSARIVALAPGMKTDIMTKGVSGRKIEVIPNGCDLDLFSSQPALENPRDCFEWLGGRPFILYAGAIGKANGVDYLVRVAEVLSDISPEIRVVVIGEGNESTNVRKLAASSNVLYKNFFLMGSMPKTRLAGWLRAADLHVALMCGPFSYTKNAVNNKFFDALACGKPIANNFEGWQAMIAETESVGIKLDPESPASAARCIVATLNDAGWLNEAGRRAAILAEGRFNRDRLSDQLFEVLCAAVAESGKH